MEENGIFLDTTIRLAVEIVILESRCWCILSMFLGCCRILNIDKAVIFYVPEIWQKKKKKGRKEKKKEKEIAWSFKEHNTEIKSAFVKSTL